MALTIQKLKEDGEYIGFNKELGYLYKLNDTIYAFNGGGLTQVNEADLIQ